MQTLDPKSASAPEEDGAKPAAKASRRRHQRGLLLVGLFKLSKAIFFGALGAGALRLIHRNIGDVVLRMVDKLPVDPEGHFVGMLMDKADLIGGHQLRQFSMFTLAYSVLCLIEGTGLMLEKVWAEYFTVTLTVLALPWESYELVRRFTWFKVALLLLNLVVLIYLLWLLRRRKQQREPES